jgi:gliding motility-associated-like protein
MKLSYTKIRHVLLLGLCILFAMPRSQAQLTIVDNVTAAQLVDKLVGVGVITLNPTMTCRTGGAGTFSGISNLGIDSGIVLTTGAAKTNTATFTTGVDAIATNGMLSSAANNGGDADLSALMNGATTNNACVLQFDFIPAGDTVKFQYVFGSEEYPEYACSQFNDAFAFLISGPGIVSNIPSIPTKRNIALVPGTTNVPIAINTVNGGAGTFGNITTCNAIATGSPFTAYYVDNLTPTANPNIVFDGMTTVLTAIQSVVPCDTYRLKLAVADVSDGSLNSGVFLKAGSLNSIALSAGASGMNITTSDTAFIVRGCPQADVTISRPNAAPLPLTIPYQLSGTAVNGVDYQLLTGTVTIPANATTGHVYVKALPLPVAGADKTVWIKFLSPYSCSANPVVLDSAIVVIQDSIHVTIDVGDTAMCFGQILDVNVETDTIFGPLSYVWNPTLGVTAPTIDFASISFPAPGIYNYNLYVNIPSLDTNCRVSNASFTVDVQTIGVNIGSDTSMCTYDSLFMFVETNPQDTGAFTYKWMPESNFNDPYRIAPIFKANATTDIIVMATTPAGCVGSDTMTVTVYPGEFLNVLPGDTSICPNQSVPVSAYSTIDNQPLDPDNTYSWTPTNWVSDPNSLTPTFSPITTTQFRLLATSEYGCIDTQFVNITVHPAAAVSLPDSVVIWAGESYQLEPSTNAVHFNWFPVSGINNSSLSNPLFSPLVNTRYFYTATTDEGCSVSDSIDFIVRQEGVADMPNAFNPNNTTFKPSFRGNFAMEIFEIYDRWGQKIFSSSNINSGWDGKLNGMPQPNGVYVYIIRLRDAQTGKMVNKTGNVTLLR